MGQETIPLARWVNVLNDATANSAVPTLATEGIARPTNWDGKLILGRLRHTAAGARTATLTLYGYIPSVLDEDGAAVTGAAGWTDTGETLTVSGSTDVDEIQSGASYEGLTVFQRLYWRVTSISGSPTINVDMAFTE